MKIDTTAIPAAITAASTAKLINDLRAEASPRNPRIKPTDKGLLIAAANRLEELMARQRKRGVPRGHAARRLIVNTPLDIEVRPDEPSPECPV